MGRDEVIKSIDINRFVNGIWFPIIYIRKLTLEGITRKEWKRRNKRV